MVKCACETDKKSPNLDFVFEIGLIFDKSVSKKEEKVGVIENLKNKIDLGESESNDLFERVIGSFLRGARKNDKNHCQKSLSKI